MWKVFLGWVPCHPTAFADSTLISECGLFDKSMKNAGDYALFLKWFMIAGVRPHNLKRDVTRMELGGFSTASYGNMWIGAREVKQAWIDLGLKGGWFAPYGKMLQKIPQELFAKIWKRDE